MPGRGAAGDLVRVRVTLTLTLTQTQTLTLSLSLTPTPTLTLTRPALPSLAHAAMLRMLDVQASLLGKLPA